MTNVVLGLSVEETFNLSDVDVADLCDSAESAILDGGGFGWLTPPPRAVLERYWRGVLLVPERKFFVGRYEGRVVGSAQLVCAARNNEAQKGNATIMSNFVAPWARGHGLARDLTLACEKSARENGVRVINLDVRGTQKAAIQLYESLGYVHWGTNPNYAVVSGKTVVGRYYTKILKNHSGKRGRSI